MMAMVEVGMQEHGSWGVTESQLRCSILASDSCNGLRPQIPKPVASLVCLWPTEMETSKLGLAEVR